MRESNGMLTISWSAWYRPDWDDTPARYLDHEVLAWGRSRRLGKAEDANRAFKAYLGVQHFEPSRWHAAGEARAQYFLSLFLRGRTVMLRSYPTMRAALEELCAFHAQLPRTGVAGQPPPGA